MSKPFKVSEQATKFKVGEVVAWQIQSAGTRVKKRGIVLAVLEADESLLERLNLVGHVGVIQSRIRASDWAKSRRYLMLVQPPVKGSRSHVPPVFYAPMVKVLDGTSAGHGRKVRG